VLNREEEYQGEMPWENNQIFQAMFIGENGLERKKESVCGRLFGAKLF
jgi:hypothetical protein